MAITDASLRAALALYRDPEPWEYAPLTGGVRRCYYPAESRVRALYLPQAGPRQTDCCTFVEGVVLAAAGINGPRWNRARHRRSMIADESQAAALRWLQWHPHGDTHDHRTKRALLVGLPAELNAVGLADEPVSAVDRPQAGEWWVGQLWTRDWGSGHAVLVETYGVAVLVHEASRSAGRVLTRRVEAWPPLSHYWQTWARLRVG